MQLRVPGDKSITHRALILAALAPRGGRLRGGLDAADTQATAAVLRTLGARIDALTAGETRVHAGGAAALRSPAGVLQCGNSGTTARLLMGVLAPRPLRATLDGDASLRGRPMRRVSEPLARMGARFRELGLPDRLPLEVSGGTLQPLNWISPQASAQVKSALLLAGLGAGVPVSVREPYRSRDHTERMLRSLGVDVREEGAAGEHRVTLEPGAEPEEVDVAIPGDFSAAAFLLGACALLRRADVVVAGVGVNPTRTGLLAVLARMGAAVECSAPRESGGEPVADLRLRPGPLRGARVTAAELPALVDEVPLLAVLAARAEGDTLITGAAELRVKESDRLAALAAGLRAVGVGAQEQPDGLVVHGTTAPLRGRVEARGDHRIAMAFEVLGTGPGCSIEVDEPALAGVSFPGFQAALRRITARNS